jgi:hypothetical protein
MSLHFKIGMMCNGCCAGLNVSWIPRGAAPDSRAITPSQAVIRLRLHRFGQQQSCRVSTKLVKHVWRALTATGSCHPKDAFANGTQAGGVHDEHGGYVDLASTLSVRDIGIALSSIVSYLHTAQLCHGVNDRCVFVGDAAFRFHYSATPSSVSTQCSPFTSTTFYTHSNGAQSQVRTQLNTQCAVDFNSAAGDMSKVELFEPSLHHYDCTDFYESTGKYDGSSPLPSMICTSCAKLRKNVHAARDRGKQTGAHAKITRKLYLGSDGQSVKDAPSENGVTLSVVTEPESADQCPVSFAALHALSCDSRVHIYMITVMYVLVVQNECSPKFKLLYSLAPCRQPAGTVGHYLGV